MRIPTYWLILWTITMMACADTPPQEASELPAVPDTISRNSDRDPTPELTRNYWKLIRMYDQVPTAPLQGITVVNIRFDQDGTIFGFSGCNSVGGTYAFTENTIHFTPETTTAVSCQHETEEALFLQMLRNAAYYNLSIDSLILFDRSRGRIGAFKSVSSLLLFH